MNFSDVAAPFLLLDAARCKKNIARMAEKARKSNCELRPHFKTHQSAEVGTWFKDAGITGITVASVSMANYFASAGWDDITIAFPFYPAMLKELQILQNRAALRLFVNSEKHLKLLNDMLPRPFSYYIEIDAGYARSGIPYIEEEPIHKLATASQTYPNAVFHGFYIHDGRTYNCKGKEEILGAIQPSIDVLADLKTKYPDAKISLGDTPSASVMDDFSPLDECTAGNFVFYDWTQVQIGSCSPDDVALFLVAPVAQIKQLNNAAIIKAGAAHFSKDYVPLSNGKNFAQLITYTPEKIDVRPEYVCAVSQEHGTVQIGADFDEDVITTIPAHSCLTANLHKFYVTEHGEKLSKRLLS